MKKIVVILSTLLLFSLSASAEKYRFGGSLGYYAVSDSTYKNTYGSGNFMYGGFISYDLLKILELRGEIGYFKDSGKMTLTKEKIEFSIIPLVLGTRVKLAEIKNLKPYAGAGIDFYSFKEKARLGDTSDSTFGFHVEAGAYIGLLWRLYFDLNLRYVKADAKPYDEEIRLGGLKTGIGVGLSF